MEDTDIDSKSLHKTKDRNVWQRIGVTFIIDEIQEVTFKEHSHWPTVPAHQTETTSALKMMTAKVYVRHG